MSTLPTITATAGELVNELDASRILSIAVETLRTWRKNARGPRFLKMSTGRRGPVRYLRSDLIAFISAACVGGGTVGK